jgi:hypothetical protein
MVAEPDAVVRLTRLQAELAGDMAAMRERAAETGELLGRWDAEGKLARPELVLLAVNLHGWYTALETALERVARLLDQTVPEGAAWHLDLLAQMRLDVPAVRPAVIPEGAQSSLQELRKFRHFFRNAYVLDLDPAQVRQRAADLLAVSAPVSASLAHLQDHLAAVLAELTRG